MLTDQAIPPEFEAVLDADETILWIGRPVLLPFLASGVPFLMFGLLWGAFDYGFISSTRWDWSMFSFFAVHSIPFWASILNMGRLALVSGNTHYSYTNKRLLIRSGFFGTGFSAIDYDKIPELEVKVSPFENLFGVGTVRRVSEPGAENNSLFSPIYDRFIAIRAPYEVFKGIKQASVDIKTDWNYPNAVRPPENPGYRTKYRPDPAAGSG